MDNSRDTGYARFAWIVLAFNLAVILWGVVVRATGSGAGCGSHWPLCNGEVLPRSPAVETLIELGHRATSGIALLLVAALVVLAWRRFPRAHPVRTAAALSAVFIVIEALIGAGLVLFELVGDNSSWARGAWIAGHVVNTLFLVGCLALTATWATHPPCDTRLDHRPFAGRFAAAFVAVLVLSASGAITALGDTLFPASSLAEGTRQTFSPSAHPFVRLRVWHPILAFVVGSGLLVLAATTAGASPSARRPALALSLLVLVEIFVGIINLQLLAPISLQLLHVLLADALWIALVLLAAAAMFDTTQRNAAVVPPAMPPFGDGRSRLL